MRRIILVFTLCVLNFAYVQGAIVQPQDVADEIRRQCQGYDCAAARERYWD